MTCLLLDQSNEQLMSVLRGLALLSLLLFSFSAFVSASSAAFAFL
jgi:hypothetical protein